MPSPIVTKKINEMEERRESEEESDVETTFERKETKQEQAGSTKKKPSLYWEEKEDPDKIDQTEEIRVEKTKNLLSLFFSIISGGIVHHGIYKIIDLHVLYEIQWSRVVKVKGMSGSSSKGKRGKSSSARATPQEQLEQLINANSRPSLNARAARATQRKQELLKRKSNSLNAREELPSSCSKEPNARYSIARGKVVKFIIRLVIS